MDQAKGGTEQAGTVHPFQAAGLGAAPFQFVGMEHRTFQALPGAPVQVGGSCDYCGTGISYFCWILSADGRRFKVGTDCVAKTDPALEAEVKAARNEERAAEKAARRIAAAQEREERETRDRAARAESLMDQYGVRGAFEIGARAVASALPPKSALILQDLHAKLVRFGSLSPKQIAFALRLAEEISNPPAPEVNIPAPEGRVTADGTIVATREVPDRFSFTPGAVTFKMIVRVETPAGGWSVWMTVPRGLPGTLAELKGKRIRFTATLTRGRDAHFAFGKRPTIWTEEGIREAEEKKAGRTQTKEEVNA